MSAPQLEADLQVALVEHLATAILLLDAGGELVWMNPSAENLLGVSARQVIGQGADLLWPPATTLSLAIAEVAGGGPALVFREIALQGRFRSEPIRVDCVITRLPTDAGESRVLIEMQLSDHDRKLVREADSEAQQRLAHRMVCNLAHELRNPLAGLRGAAQLLERKLEQADLHEYTRIIIGEADRLGALVSQLLGPQQPARKRAVNLHQPLEHVRRLVAAGLTEAIGIERDYDPSLPDLQLDPDQLVQALLNLLRNACEALEQSDQGLIRLRTRVVHNQVIGGHSHRQCARISVIDNGPGIPPDRLERIFFPMVSGHPQRSGLGLAIARSLVAANGGRIDCTSRPGRTEFMIDLPLDVASGQALGER
jgi:two-component system, NtrC family, nitrogen regulation sensor histidine kinase GlnL